MTLYLREDMLNTQMLSQRITNRCSMLAMASFSIIGGTRAMSSAQHCSSSHESSRLHCDESIFTLALTFLPEIDLVFLTTLGLAAPKPWEKSRDAGCQWHCSRLVGRWKTEAVEGVRRQRRLRTNSGKHCDLL